VGAMSSNNAVPKTAGGDPPLPVGSTGAIMKARQGAKLRELRQALIDDGYVGLCSQAAALGIRRSTAWVVLNGRYKTSGLSASIVEQMMASPKLPPRARRVLQDYIAAKSAGLYGYDRKSVRAFQKKLSFSEIPTNYEGGGAARENVTIKPA
jgi:hypothetical protein